MMIGIKGIGMMPEFAAGKDFQEGRKPDAINNSTVKSFLLHTYVYLHAIQSQDLAIIRIIH